MTMTGNEWLDDLTDSFFLVIQCAASRDTQLQRTGSCLVSYDFFLFAFISMPYED